MQGTLAPVNIHSFGKVIGCASAGLMDVFTPKSGQGV
jgi:hypothetical protein